MKIKSLFERDILRPINGVVKADQLDEASVWQELEEFVITKELDQHLRRFIGWYLEALDQDKKAVAAGKIGIWISGFFGSGKSHFLKVLSYLLRNSTHSFDGQTKPAVEFFEGKVKDAMLFADIQRAVAANTDVILFNIDLKADHGSGRDLILRVFLRVLNELQGFSGDHPHIAHMERYLASRGRLIAFQDAYRKQTGAEWVKERDAYQFNRDDVVKVFAETLGQSQTAAEKWIDSAEETFSLTVENFCKWVKQYLDAKGPQHRLAFLVDEVGGFIGTDSALMLNLQTITEELGLSCQRRAWVVVTSQEDMDTVLGEMTKAKRQDFSKIQGRFFPPLSLSSANVDEVIQSRLLAKVPAVKDELAQLFEQKGDILKNQLTFMDCGMTFRKIGSLEEFIKNYPFVPYQFQLLQKVFEAIRKVGASGMHLARGERSMLDAFQSAARAVSLKDAGVLVPLYEFYPSIESFLDTAVKRTIDQAGSNPSLEPEDIRLLQVLFLIRYVGEMKGNVDNLVTLCLDQIDADRLALRRRIEESLARLEKETLISRTGDLYAFLTNEERDINKEIKAVELSSGAEAKLLGEIVFDDVLSGQRKHRFSANKMDFEFNRRCDGCVLGHERDGALLASVITPLDDDYELYEKAKCVLDSTAENGLVLVRLPNDESLGREVRTFLQTETYLSRKNDGTLPDSTKAILFACAEENRRRRERLMGQLGEMLAAAEYYVAGQPLKPKATGPVTILAEAFEYLIKNTFDKMSYLKRLSPEPLKELQAVLRSNDIAKEQLLFETGENNPEAIGDLRTYLDLCAKTSRQVVLHDMIEKRYSLRPYGWPDEEVLLLVGRLVVLGEISLVMDGAALPLDKVYESITAPAKRRKVVLLKRQAPDPDALRKARELGKELFAEMGPDGGDPLYAFLHGRLREWQINLRAHQQLADTGDYPGREEISQGLGIINKLVGEKDSFKFIERFNLLKSELEELGESYGDLQQFFTVQRPTWEKLRRGFTRFQLNRLELDRDTTSAPALRRMGEILSAVSPYGLLREANGLIETVAAVNSKLLSERRQQALGKIDGHCATLTKELAAAGGDTDLQGACLKPLELLRKQVEAQLSLAHITQDEAEAVREFDQAMARIEAFCRKREEQPPAPGTAKSDAPKVVIRKQRVIRAAELMSGAFLETQADVDAFVEALRAELEKALKNNERIQVR